MNCLIVDDNKLARNLMAQLLKNFAHLNLIAECEDPVQALEIMKKEKVDLIFLDIEMPKMTGLEFLSILDTKPLIILITAKPEYAVEAFEHNVVDFLVAPIKTDRLAKAIQRADELFEAQPASLEASTKDYVFIKEKSVLTKLHFQDMLYLQALGDYVTIFTASKKNTLRLNLRIAEEKLPKNLFVRVHRSYLVNIDKIDSIDDNTAIIQKHFIPIGDNYKQILLKRLNLL